MVVTESLSRCENVSRMGSPQIWHAATPRSLAAPHAQHKRSGLAPQPRRTPSPPPPAPLRLTGTGRNSRENAEGVFRGLVAAMKSARAGKGEVDKRAHQTRPVRSRLTPASALAPCKFLLSPCICYFRCYFRPQTPLDRERDTERARCASKRAGKRESGRAPSEDCRFVRPMPHCDSAPMPHCDSAPSSSSIFESTGQESSDPNPPKRDLPNILVGNDPR